MSWAWWSWNPESAPTGGILENDWRTVDQAKLAKLVPVMFGPQPQAPARTEVTFTISLSSPATEVVSVDYRTVPNGSRAAGVAIAGGDFASIAGTIQFLPGEQTKTIRTTIAADSLVEGNETLTIELSNAKNGLLGRATATVTIIDDDLATTQFNEVRGGGGNDVVTGVAGANVLYGGAGNDTVGGQGAADLLSGEAGADQLSGAAGNDRLYGDEGDDTLQGGAGADTLFGGTGFDIASYAGSAAGVSITLNTLVAVGVGGDAAGDLLVGIEGLVGSAFADSLASDARDGRLDGGAGNDTLAGGGGSDTLLGGIGDDVVQGQDGDDLLTGGTGLDTLDGGAGTDTASYASSAAGVAVDLSLAGAQLGGGDAVGDVLAAVEHLIGSAYADALTGSTGDNSLSGGEGNDVLVGGAGNDTLSGGGGADTLTGGAGADTLDGGAGQDRASYASSTAGVTVNLLAGTATGGDAAGDVLTGIEDLEGSAYADALTGEGLANRLLGGSGNDTLAGGGADDTLDGGAGADALDGGTGRDRVTFALSAVGVTVSLASGTGAGGDAAGDTLTAVEDLEGSAFGDVLTGDGLANLLLGGGGSDTLDGGLGADSLVGGGGNDVFLVDNVGDVVVEALSEGTDEVRTSLASYALDAPIENLTYAGSAAFAGTGNTLANVILGASGNDTLSGGAGADTLDGGTGTDAATYAASSLGVTVSLVAGLNTGGDAEGDVLLAVENLTGSGFADRLTGNAGANVLTGGAGDDTLDGGSGADTLIGGTGNDVLVVDATTDVVTESAGEGTDLIRTTLARYVLGANLESLAYVGAATFTGTGNSLANTLVGGAGDDVLDGGAGHDVLAGGDGSDNLVGGTGIDTMEGGAGDDYYYVADTSDVVTEVANAGLDRVFATASYTLSANIEALFLQGTAVSRRGNSGDNTIIGNAESNALYGEDGSDYLVDGSGADGMVGGAGDDFYFVSSLGGTIYENAGGGFDRIFSTVSTVMAANVEALILQGTGNINGTGNASDNGIVANDADNVLTGGAGNDEIYGKNGNDTFVFRAGDGRDIVADFQGAGAPGGDVLHIDSALAANFAALQSRGTQSGADGTYDFGNGTTLTLWNVIIAGLSQSDVVFI